MNKQINVSRNSGSDKAAFKAVPEQEIKRPYSGPSVQTRDSDHLRDLLANVTAATGFVQP